jgi:hypothetical protein
MALVCGKSTLLPRSQRSLQIAELSIGLRELAFAYPKPIVEPYPPVGVVCDPVLESVALAVGLAPADELPPPTAGLLGSVTST